MIMVRQMEEKDIPQTIALLKASWARTYDHVIGAEARKEISDKKHTVVRLVDEIKAPNSIAIVALDDNEEIIGHVGGEMKGEAGTFFVDRLHVDPKYFGKDVAAQLMDLLSKILLKQSTMNTDRIELTVLEGNGRAFGFYYKFGFKNASGDNEDDGLGGIPSQLLRYELT